MREVADKKSDRRKKAGSASALIGEVTFVVAACFGPQDVAACFGPQDVAVGAQPLRPVIQSRVTLVREKQCDL